MVLGFSLLKANTSHQIVCMVTPAVEAHVRTLLARVFDRIIEVLPPEVSGVRTHQSDSWSKLCAWTLIEYSRIVYLGSDTLVLRNVDELFNCQPPCGVIDLFLWETTEHGPTVNGDVLVLQPSLADYEQLLHYPKTWRRDKDEDAVFIKAWSDLYDGTMITGRKTRLGPYDQALINRYFSRSITVLPYHYNVMPYLLVPKEQMERDWIWDLERAKIIHYAIHKPWKHEPEPYLDSTGAFMPWRNIAEELFLWLPDSKALQTY
eukprot:CAMPEP_0184334772 /NCGR_PEP_ID=MMETSP1089-20130417/3442_1 /TAXON_ID=38269 ORGANISM="Gloeochaete wittrockiana, Strain SAG46.84" /NCGR_SAMPLE_ID=MMETSP1089 /ASSEMBLY_ACC=CAM_ASM_000445 /LENGTH=261 /DNA_ID=CAMNT_0026659119 /DNA_START=267 /DNA_END=1052 /DNA_ORIENTATION=+